MEIFKLGDDILALLEMVLGFWNNQINLVFSLLGQSPVSFKGGGPWAVVENLQPLFVGVGSGLVVLFFVIGFCAESVDIKSVVLCQEKVQVKRGLFVESMESYSTVFCDHVFQIIQFGYHLFTEFLNPIHDVFQQITQFCSLPNQCLHVFRLHPALPPFILSIPPLSPASHSNS